MLKYNYFSTDNHIELIPNQKPVGSIIWLHGLGANGNDFVPIANELKMDDLALRFIFPHAPLRAVTLNNGHVMPAWFDIYSLDRNQIIDEQGISDSNALLKHYIDHEVEQKIPANKIVLAGFSQGAVIALTTGLHYSSALAGLIALSGYLPGIEKNTHALGNANKNTPIFIGHGKEDTLIPYHYGEETARFLQKMNYPVDFHLYPMPHSVCDAEVSDIRTWLQDIYQLKI